ncbi:MAG TPA: pyridoxal-phosphate dependent enzyme, partial [Kofleriaceae bacterium]|nr:pyridoxal-phosphate dependent enzyme [Kofleriaceae bacterium]
MADKLGAERGWFIARQFDNPANPAFHRQTTGPEILSDFASMRLDYWITGYGTGGTMTGAGQMIKAAWPHTKVVACEPTNAALLDGKEWKPHKIQGWTPDFVPSVLDRDVYDQLLAVSNERALACARELARREGIFCGISSGGTFSAALEVASEAPAGSVILAMLPD